MGSESEAFAYVPRRRTNDAKLAPRPRRLGEASSVRVMLSLLLAALAVSGCGAPDVPTTKPDRCGAVHAGMRKLTNEVDSLNQQLTDLGSRPSPSTVDLEPQANAPDWWYQDVPDDSVGQRWDNRTSSVNLRLRQTITLASHLMVENPSCYEPLDVARAKMLLGQ